MFLLLIILFLLSLIHVFVMRSTRTIQDLVMVPIDDTKPFLVLDLDYTLVNWFNKRRRHIARFLSFAMPRYNIVIWSARYEYYTWVTVASFNRDYGLRVVKVMSPRDMSRGEDGKFKSLYTLAHQLGRAQICAIAVDDDPRNFADTPQSRIVIGKWEDGGNDNALLDVISQLKK